MGRGDVEEAIPLTSADGDDTLPLYEDTESGPSSDLSPPTETATPDDVRAYIISVMLARGIGLDHARRVAARWTLGTGRELRQYPATMFKEIFGPEDGWVVFKETRVPYYREDRKKPDHTRTILAALLAADVIFLIMMGIFLMTGVGDGLPIIFGMFAFFPVIPLLVGVICFKKTSPEDQAENELKNQWKAPQNSSSGGQS
jgi:hypothetical protein